MWIISLNLVVDVNVLAPTEHNITEGKEAHRVCTRLSTGNNYRIETGISLRIISHGVTGTR